MRFTIILALAGLLLSSNAFADSADEKADTKGTAVPADEPAGNDSEDAEAAKPKPAEKPAMTVAKPEEVFGADYAKRSSNGSTTNVDKPLSIAGVAGYGFADGLKTGFGGRIGYTLPSKLYIGGTFIYHMGTSEQMVEVNAWYLGGEVGVDIAAGPTVIRLYGGAGVANSSATVSIPPMHNSPAFSASASENRFVAWPGATFLVPFADNSMFIGADARLLIVPDAADHEDGASFLTYATAGLAF